MRARSPFSLLRAACGESQGELTRMHEVADFFHIMASKDGSGARTGHPTTTSVSGTAIFCTAHS